MVECGLERIVYSLARHLARLGEEVSLYALPGSSAPEGVELVEVERIEDLLTPEGERDLLSNHEIVHAHDWNLIAWQLAQLHPGRPFVQTWHGPSLGPKVNWSRPPENLCLCAISRWHHLILGAELDCLPVFVHNGIELEDFPLYEGPREDYLVYLNRLGQEKGLHLAIALAKQAEMQLRVAGTEKFVGDPNYTLQMLRRMDGEEVVFEGDLGQERKYQLLSRARALLWVPVSFEEPFGLGVVEAMACGTPVIVRDSGDLRELVPEVAILSHPWDGLATPLHLSQGYQPQHWRHAAERFSAEMMAEGYLALYRDLLESWAPERSEERVVALPVR